MESEKISFSIDKDTDTLRVNIVDSKVASFGPAPEDSHIMLEKDANGDVIGIEIQGVSKLSHETWPQHPVRDSLPLILLAEVDELKILFCGCASCLS